MIAKSSAGGPVIRHRRLLAAPSAVLPGAVLLMGALTLTACAVEDRTPSSDTQTVPAIAVPMSDSAADSAAREGEERSTISPPPGDTAERPMIRPARPDTATARPSAQRATGADGDSILVRLERTACLGSCPVYSLALRGDGSVAYEGRDHVERAGAADTTVSRAAVQGIVDAASTAGFFGMADRYAYGEPTCPLYTADSPRTFITIAAGSRSKRIEHDYGCENGPQALVALANRIDSVAGVDRWLGPRHDH